MTKQVAATVFMCALERCHNFFMILYKLISSLTHCSYFYVWLKNDDINFSWPILIWSHDRHLILTTEPYLLLHGSNIGTVQANDWQSRPRGTRVAPKLWVWVSCELKNYSINLLLSPFYLVQLLCIWPPCSFVCSTLSSIVLLHFPSPQSSC